MSARNSARSSLSTSTEVLQRTVAERVPPSDNAASPKLSPAPRTASVMVRSGPDTGAKFALEASPLADLHAKSAAGELNGNYFDSLVSDGYLRKLPDDPFTKSSSSWQSIPAEPDPNNPIAEPGVYDVKSGADGTALDGTKYSEW